MSDFSALNIIFKFVILAHFIHIGRCTIVGLSYMDPLRQRPLPPGDNPCNPLYWYPRAIPEQCYVKTPTPVKPPLPPQPVPMPIAVPYPQPMPMPMPMPYSMMPAPMGPPAPMPFGVPFQGPQQFPFSPPLPMPQPFPVPAPSYSYPYGVGQAGMVPGLPGLVAADGGINVLPFSDVYADVLEKHKQKMVRRRLEEFLDKHGGSGRYKKHKKCSRHSD